MIQQYGRVGQGLYGATAPAIANNPTPTVGVANSGIASGALDVSGAAKTAARNGYDARVMQKKKQRGEVDTQEGETKTPLAGLGATTGSGSIGGGTATGSLSSAAKTPLLANSLANSPVMAAGREQLQARAPLLQPQAVSQSYRDNVPDNINHGGPGYEGSLSQQINNRNPDANPDMSYVQKGNTGGFLEGVGVTIAPGRSITPALAQQQKLQALQQGVPAEFIDDFLSRNRGDTNRLIEGYNSERNNTRGGSWQNYALPSAEEAADYFRGQNEGLSAPVQPMQQPMQPQGPTREQIEAELRAQIEQENRMKAVTEAAALSAQQNKQGRRDSRGNIVYSR